MLPHTTKEFELNHTYLGESLQNIYRKPNRPPDNPSYKASEETVYLHMVSW